MDNDLQSRSEIVSNGERRNYDAFVRSLVFLPTVREIREAVASTDGLQPSILTAAIKSVAAEWRDAGHGAQLQLLDFVTGLVDSLLHDTSDERDSSIKDARSLVPLLMRAPNALRMRGMLVRYQELVSDDLLQAMTEQIADRRGSPPSKEVCLALYLIARVLGDDKELITGLLVWGSYCRGAQALGRAERHFRRAAHLARAHDDPTTRLMIIGAQVGLYRAMHRYRDACTTLEEGLTLASDAEHAYIAFGLLQALASCYRAAGQTAKALDTASRMIAFSELPPGKKSLSLNLRGLLYEDLGRYELGAIDFEEAAKAAAAEGDRSAEFEALTNGAASLLKRGMSREGYHAFLGVLRQAERWGNPLMMASTHNNLGHALCEMEDYTGASVEYGKALQVKINSPGSSGEVTTMLGLGQCRKRLGDPEGADVFHTLALMSALESGDANLVGQVQLALCDERADPEGSLASLKSARHLASQNSQREIEAVLATRIVSLLRSTGRIDDALEECTALARSSTDGVEYAGLLALRVEYAKLLGSREQSWREGFEFLSEILSATEKQMRETVIDSRLSEIAGASRIVYEGLLELLSQPWATVPEGRPPATLGFDLHESGKARSLLAQVTDAHALHPPASVPDALQKAERALLREEAQWQSQRAPSEALRHERLSSIRQQLNDCWDRMRPVAPEYVRARSAEPYTFEEILETLRTTATVKTALLSFFVQQDKTACFVVRADCDEPKMLFLALSADQLTQTVRQLHRAYNGAPDEFPPYPPIRGDAPFRRKLGLIDVMNEAMAPVLAALEGIDLICVAPHRMLHSLPLHALQLPSGQFVGERFGVIYTPSLSVATSKARRQSASISKCATPSRAFVAGVSSSDDDYPEFFEDDAALFDPAYWQVHPAIGVQDATPDAVVSGLQGSRAVHISCHAFFNARNPLTSGLILSNGKSKAPRDLSRLSFVERQPYLVTVRDLMRVELDAELVTLSACSSGMQRERNGGDELEGFARTLLGAGSDAALLAMWNVDQSSSRELLSRFYRNWAALGMPKWQALQTAQQDFIASATNLRHPYHWAPFCLVGTWR